MRPVQIRTAAPEEAPLITPLCAEHAAYERADFEHEEHASRLAAMMSGPVPRIVIFVAELDAHEIIGYAAVSTIVCHVISTKSHFVAGTYFTTLTHMHNTHPPIKLRGMQCRWI
jgi:hypothetical protein